MSDITKDFAGGRVLHGVDFSLLAGEVHAIVGHNGAGKSTLVKILGGVYSDYGGTLEIEGHSVVLHEPKSAIEAGVAIIHQDFTLVPFFTVAQNISLGQEPRGRLPGSVNLGEVARIGMREAAALQIQLPIGARVADLGVAAQQLTEIVKAVSRKARILVMDEPTARLSRSERDHLFRIIRDLTAGGVGVIYISHFLEEIFDIADRVTVLRDGHVVHTGPAEGLDLERLTHLVAGSRLETAVKGRESTMARGTVALHLAGFGVHHRIGPVDLEIARGEIVGLAGLVGSGRTALARGLVGGVPGTYGSISLESWTGRPRSPTEAASRGIILLTEDRKREGIIGVRPMGENVIATALGRLRELVMLGLVRRGNRDRLVARVVTRLRIVPADPGKPAATFSGGNQQKVLFARAIAAATPVLILDQPTAGVDVGAKADLYEQIDHLARSGISIILISDDLDELLALCDRVAVVRKGQLEAVRPADDFDRAELLRAITLGAPAAVPVAT